MSADLEIKLCDARFHAHHGVMPQERIIGNEFAVDLTVTIPLNPTGKLADAVTDEIGDTISYADLHECVRRHIQHPCNLLEHLAAGIVDDITTHWQQISAINLCVTKLAPPIPNSDCKASVSIIWHR